MSLGTYNITIDFTKLFVHNSTSIYFKEGDLNTARVRAKLTMQGKVIDLSGCNVYLKIETLNGNTITDATNILDASNGIVEIDFKTNALIEGTNFFELIIVKGKSVKKSPKMAYRVLDSIEDANSVEGANEYPILIQLINNTNKAIEDANEALELANTMKSNLEEVINNANIATSNAQASTNNANAKIEEVDRALAAGTQDLEVKAAREDAEGVTHDTLDLRLKSDLKIGEKSLKQEVLDLLELKEVQEMTYESSNGYLLCKETKKGIIKDLNISGKSLVNNCDSLVSSFEISATLNRKICDFEFKAGKTYTLVVDFGEGGSTSQNTDDIFICQASLSYENIKGSEAKGTITRRIVPKDNVKGWLMGARGGLVGKVTARKFMILEGDYTKNPPNFFKGIASVGTGSDKIEISSSDNADRVDKKNILFKDTDNSWKPIKELRSCPECFDSIELHNDGKYYHHVRVEKKLYAPGDENNSNVITDKTNTIAKLAKEKVFEVNPLFLESFENSTSFTCNSGVINANIELKVTSHISNLVLLNQQRISILEQEMFSMFKQVLSGDMYSLAERLYPEDFIEEKHIATPIPEL